jgi:polysaccharide export outer membrane protein
MRVLACLAVVLAGAAWAAEYHLVAGDKIMVTVLRHDELTKAYTVPPDGQIDFPRVGRLVVIGKTATEVTALLTAELGKFMRDPEVTVALLDIHARTAYVLGAVARPGQYPLTDGARITELLAAAGDLVGDRGKLTATLVRGTVTLPVNLPAVLAGNTPAANLTLREGDLLWVQEPVKITVLVSGFVKNPGMVKLNQGSALTDALAQAGDLSDRPERVRITLQRGPHATPVRWGDAVPLQDGDLVLVEREAVARVFVNGHVKNPGAYDLPQGGGVLEALALAGGVLATPALGQVTIQHAGGATERVNLAPALLEGRLSENPKLRPGDLVIVPESTARVAVLGLVRNPGSFPLNVSRPISVVDAISLAGGRDQRGDLAQVRIIRVENGKPKMIAVNVKNLLDNKGDTKANLTLHDGDVVYVPEFRSPDWERIIRNVSLLGFLTALKP